MSQLSRFCPSAETNSQMNKTKTLKWSLLIRAMPMYFFKERTIKNKELSNSKKMNILDPYRNGVKNKSISQICSWTGFLGFTKLSYIFTQIPAVWLTPFILGFISFSKGWLSIPRFLCQ